MSLKEIETVVIYAITVQKGYSDAQIPIKANCESSLMETKQSTLIADSGSSHAKWALLKANTEVAKVETKGINMYFSKEEDVKQMLIDQVLPLTDNQADDVKDIYFYGAALSSPKNQEFLRTILSAVFPKSMIYINTDVEAAARGLCIHECGIACIIGTGSSSCYYDGTQITENRIGRGFILGDEGSGAYLGKLLMQGFVNDSFDSELRALFSKSYPNVTVDYVLERVYRAGSVNVFFAEFAPFYSQNRGVKWIENTLDRSIRDFIETHLLRFTKVKDCPINFTGSVAMAFEADWQRLLKEYGLKMGKVEKTPLLGLVKYHQTS